MKSQKLLLESSDPITGIQKALAGILRSTVQDKFAAHELAFNNAAKALDANEAWKKVPFDDQEAIREAVDLKPPAKPEMSKDDELVDQLDQKPLLAMQAEIDAIEGRVNQAMQRAARLLEPRLQTVTLERSTLRDEVEVEEWIQRQKKALMDAVAEGPVMVN